MTTLDKSSEPTSTISLKSLSWKEFAINVLLPQPWKYSVLKKESIAVLDFNALHSNLVRFAGSEAEDYEVRHEQSADTILDIHTNAASTKRLIETYLRPGSLLLEIGSGTGYWAPVILSRCDKAVINELSPDMMRVNIAARTPGELAKVQDFHCGSVQQIVDDCAASGKRFDRIVAISTLHHLEHRGEQMALLWRVLADGGELFFVDPTHNIKRVYRVLKKLAVEYRAPFIPDVHDFLTLSEVSGWVNSGLLKSARLIALGTTQFPLAGRFSRWPKLYLAIDATLRHIPLLRGQGNMIYAVIRKDSTQ